MKLNTSLPVTYSTSNKTPSTVYYLVASAWLRTAFIKCIKSNRNTFTCRGSKHVPACWDSLSAHQSFLTPGLFEKDPVHTGWNQYLNKSKHDRAQELRGPARASAAASSEASAASSSAAEARGKTIRGVKKQLM